MPTATFNPVSGVSGGHRGVNNGTWSTARALTTGAGSEDHQVLAVGGYYLRRSFFVFNTATIPLDAIVTAIRLKLAREDAIIAFGNGESVNLVIIPSTQTDPATLADADFDNISFVSKGVIALSSTTNNTYFTITISDLTQVIKGGYTKFAAVTSKDFDNVAPVGTSGQIGISKAGSARPPVLEVDYDLPDLGNPLFFRGGLAVG